MILADRMDDALAIADAVKERDRVRTGGRYVHHVETAWDVLGGPPAAMTRKLALLDAAPRAHRRDAAAPRRRRRRDGARVAAAREPARGAARRAPSLVRERFSERDGTFGTPVFVHYRARYSPSDGRALLVVAGLTQSVRLADGRVVPTASRATVFAEMLRAMEVDGPRATLGAFRVGGAHRAAVDPQGARLARRAGLARGRRGAHRGRRGVARHAAQLPELRGPAAHLRHRRRVRDQPLRPHALHEGTIRRPRCAPSAAR